MVESDRLKSASKILFVCLSLGVPPIFLEIRPALPLPDRPAWKSAIASRRIILAYPRPRASS